VSHPSPAIRVAASVYPLAALSSAAGQLSKVCTVDIHERDDATFDVTIQPTSASPEPHMVDEYLTLALMAMIEQRSGL
jgi:hypothetical protein